MQEIKLPNLGEGIDHGDVVRVLVHKGDTVRRQQTVIELETDKALIEVPCEVAGTVVEVLIGEGDRIKVGQVILKVEVDESAQAVAREPAADRQAPAVEAEAKETAEAKDGPQSSESPARQPALDQPGRQQLLPPASANFAPELVAPAAGPATRRLARELGVDLSRVSGSGRGGRVTRDDVRAFVQQRMQGGGVGPAATAAPVELPDFSQWGETEHAPLNAVRRTTAKHLGQTWPLIPLVTQFDSADVGQLEELRRRFKPEAEERGVRLTITVLLLKALVSALRAHPRFNASLDLANEQLVLKHYYHIGVAVDTSRGLLVPVLRDVDRKSVWQLAGELAELAGRAREGKVDLSELRGASFSLSNQGGIGGEHFTPLVNHPEVAILGVGQTRIKPVWDEASAEFKPRLTMPLALSYDHRVADGADAARLITQLKRSLEDPLRLLLGL
jgi:pyruvate dehydrogenase E2 component (dihydrolipoamide acetyltransferase)